MFIRDCKNCEMSVSCSQFRTRDCVNTKFFLYVPNDPIIEASSEITIGPYNFSYPLFEDHVKVSDLIGEFKDDDGVVQTRYNHWKEVFDFSKREDGVPNYTLIDKDQFKVVSQDGLLSDVEITGRGENPSWIFELPIEYGGTFDHSKVVKAADNLNLHDIKTGQKVE